MLEDIKDILKRMLKDIYNKNIKRYSRKNARRYIKNILKNIWIRKKNGKIG